MCVAEVKRVLACGLMHLESKNCFNAVTNLLWDVWLITVGFLPSSPDVNWENYVFSLPSASGRCPWLLPRLKFCHQVWIHVPHLFFILKIVKQKVPRYWKIWSVFQFPSCQCFKIQEEASHPRALKNDKIMSVFWWLKVSVDQSVPLFWFSVHYLYMV